MSTNRIGKDRNAYVGRPSTLCKGCGHDSITNAIVQSYFDLGVEPHKVMKLSGIGCSSKTPTYFMEQSHGFNGVHGRMPSLATGANVANRTLSCIGVSGDGDTASIGLGQYCHMVRRNVDCVYIIENNGTYGLTKGQFSATSDLGSKSKKGVPNPYPVIDCCALAIELGCGFVARSFSGDRKQVMSLLKAAHAHRGTAVLDIISPCVTFNNHEGSTKSYDYSKEHDVPLHELGFVPFFEEISVDIQDGDTQTVKLHDGSLLTIKKKSDHDYAINDRKAALMAVHDAYSRGELMTGLLFYDGSQPDHNGLLGLTEKPLCELGIDEMDPGPDFIKKLNASLK